MVQNFKMPEVKIITYQLNTDSNYYELHSQPPGFNRLPNELQVQDSIDSKMIERGAKQVVQGRQKNGKKTFFTGMRPTPDKLFLFGDDGYFLPKNKKKSFVLFQFNNDCTRLTVHYFKGYIPLKPIREQFIQTYLETL